MTMPASALVSAPTAAATMVIACRPFTQEVEDRGNKPRVALQELEQPDKSGQTMTMTTS